MDLDGATLEGCDWSCGREVSLLHSYLATHIAPDTSLPRGDNWKHHKNRETGIPDMG